MPNEINTKNYINFMPFLLILSHFRPFLLVFYGNFIDIIYNISGHQKPGITLGQEYLMLNYFNQIRYLSIK
jgi:hypothetical protein